MDLWKTVKIFVATSYQKNSLARAKLADIFAVLQEQLRQHHIALMYYDFRWQDTEYVQPVTKALEFAATSDYFIGILGDKYGWRPSEDENGNPNRDRLSMMEMEINTAIRAINQEHRWFYLLSSENTQQEERGNAADVVALTALKNRLRRTDEKVYEYQKISQLTELLPRHLKETISYPQPYRASMIEYTPEQFLQEIIAEKSELFVGRIGYIRDLENFVLGEDENNYRVVHGPTGSGKSSLIANFVKYWRKEYPEIPLVAHFIDSSGERFRVSGILRSIGIQLQKLKIIESCLQPGTAQLSKQIKSALKFTRRRLLLIIDGLSEIDDFGAELSWLPRHTPFHVRLILTTRERKPWYRLQNYSCLKTIKLEPLLAEESAQIIEHYSELYKLQLSEQQQQTLLEAAAGNPLYLKLALSPAISMQSEKWPATIEELWQKISEQLLHKYGTIFQDYLGFLSVSNGGLALSELWELMHHSQVAHEIFWDLHMASADIIVERGGIFIPRYQKLAKLFRRKMSDTATAQYHCRLAEYLWGKGIEYRRALRNICYHLLLGKKWQQLLTTLTDIEFLQAKCNASLLDELIADYKLALHSQYAISKDFCVALTAEVNINHQILLLVAKALQMDRNFLLRHPHCLFQSLWNRCYWHDAPEAAHHYQKNKLGKPAWQRRDAKVYKLMEKWRIEKENAKDFIWLRSVRPLVSHLEMPSPIVLRGHSDEVYGVAVSNDGRQIFSAAKDKCIRIWDIDSQECVLQLKGHRGIVSHVFCSNDHSRLLSASTDPLGLGRGDNSVRTWDTESGSEINSVCGDQDMVHSIAVSHNGAKIVSGSEENLVRIWDFAEGETLLTLSGHRWIVVSVAFSPDDSLVISGSWDATARIWDAQTGKCLQVLQGHEYSVTSVAFSPDGRLAATASKDKTACLWDVQSGNRLKVFKGHSEGVFTVVFTPDGRLVTGSLDKTARIWNVKKARCLSVLEGHNKGINNLAVSQNGKWLISASSDNTVRVWDIEKNICPSVLKGHTWNIAHTIVNRDRTQVASGSWDNSIRLWDIASGCCLQTLVGHRHSITSLAFTVDNKRLLSGSRDNTVRVWEQGRCLHILENHTDSVWQVLCNENCVFSGSKDKTIAICDIATGKCLNILRGHEWGVTSLALSPDNKLLASGSVDNTIRIWKLQQANSWGNYAKNIGRALLNFITGNTNSRYVLKGHRWGVTSVAFSADGQKLVSGSEDMSVRIWDVASGQTMQIFTGHDLGVTNVAFSVDGKFVASKSLDETTRIWDVDTGECTQIVEGNIDASEIVRQDTDFYVTIPKGESKIISRKDGLPLAFFHDEIERPIIANNFLLGKSRSDKEYLYIMKLS